MNILCSFGASHYGLSWSPDGSQIVFTSERDGNKELYIVSRSGDVIYTADATSCRGYEPILDKRTARLAPTGFQRAW